MLTIEGEPPSSGDGSRQDEFVRTAPMADGPCWQEPDRSRVPIAADNRTAAADLRLIAARAVELQPQAEKFIAECASDPEWGSELARAGGRVVSAYFQLREQLRMLPESSVRTRLDQLLNYHQQLLEQALLLGSRPGTEQRARVAAGFQDGLGSPAAALRDLLQELTAPPTES